MGSHDHIASNKSKTSLANALTMTETKATIPRIQTLPGSLSLHTYRKHLSQPSQPDSPDQTGTGGRKLKRKYGALNLHQIPTHHPTRAPWPPLSASSAASSPPPLSPSYSLSAMSQFSEMERDRERETLERFVCPEMAAFQEMSSEYAVRARQGGRKFDTFRDRLEQTPQLRESIDSTPDSDSEPTMVSHEGASFQILNPRQSLRAARIVSYIEDMEFPANICESRRTSWDRKRDIAEKGIPESEEITPEDASRHGDLDLLDLLSSYNTDNHNTSSEAEQQAHMDIMGDAPCTPIPSISERLQEPHRRSAQTVPDEHEHHSLKNTGLDSGYQSEKVYEPGELYNSSPRTEAFAALTAGQRSSMQDFLSSNPSGAGSASGSRRPEKTKPALTKKRGRVKGTVLQPLRRLKCW